MQINAAGVVGPPQQAVTGTLAEVVRLPLLRPHELQFGEFAGSFASPQDAIDAARQLSSGSGPAHVVVSLPKPLNQANGPWLETNAHNVYSVVDVAGPRISNPGVGWRPWNTDRTPYHFDAISGVRRLEVPRALAHLDHLQDLTLVQGDATATIGPARR